MREIKGSVSLYAERLAITSELSGLENKTIFSSFLNSAFAPTPIIISFHFKDDNY